MDFILFIEFIYFFEFIGVVNLFLNDNDYVELVSLILVFYCFIFCVNILKVLGYNCVSVIVK